MAGSVAVKQIPFSWEGTDSKGNRIKGKSIAKDESALRAELRRQGVVPVRVRKQSTLFQSKGRVTPNDIAVFSRQLATEHGDIVRCDRALRLKQIRLFAYLHRHHALTAQFGPQG